MKRFRCHGLVPLSIIGIVALALGGGMAAYVLLQTFPLGTQEEGGEQRKETSVEETNEFTFPRESQSAAENPMPPERTPPSEDFERVEITFFEAKSPVISAAEPLVLRWETVHAERCRGQGGWSGELPLRESAVSLGPFWFSQEFTLLCENERSSAKATIAVLVLELVSSEPIPDAYRLPSPSEVGAFKNWALQHDIELQGIATEIDNLYYNRYDPEKDNIPLDRVPGIFQAHNALELLEDSLLEDIMGQNTIYLSTVTERPYAVFPVLVASEGVFKGVDAGFVLPQPISAHNTLHEFGHLVHAAVENFYDLDVAPRLQQHQEQLNETFDTSGVEYDASGESPPGYLSSYAAASTGENFAEHFAFYVLEAERFRARAEKNALLERKYHFLRDAIFQGKEY